MLRTIAATGATLLLLSTGAGAADLISYPTSTAQQVPVSGTSPATDWDGFYAGVFGAYQHSATQGGQFGLGIDAGVDTTVSFFLAGAEVAVTGLTNDAGTAGYAQAIGRAGVLVGDNTLLYGAAGYGLGIGGTGAGDSDLLAGGGVEYSLTSDVSLRAQYLHGFPVTGANPKDQFTLGAQFHF